MESFGTIISSAHVNPGNLGQRSSKHKKWKFKTLIHVGDFSIIGANIDNSRKTENSEKKKYGPLGKRYLIIQD